MSPSLSFLFSRIAPGWYFNRELRKSLFSKGYSYLKVTGWIQSMRTRECRGADGEVVPWMNYSIIAVLNERLTSELRVFEYGSGFSTSYFAKKCHSVVSVEYNQEWYDRVRLRMPGNVKLMLVPSDEDGKYCRAIAEEGASYDVVVVDGNDRVNCMIQAVSALSGRGVVILDDSNREEYKAGFSFLAARGFRRLTFEGLKPTHAGMHHTTIFYRDSNCLGI